MSVLLIDFEATGLDPKEARVIEIGARMVTEDMQHTIGIPLSHLVWAPDYPSISPEVEKVTGISEAMLRADGLSPISAFMALGEMVTVDTSAVIAYNISYDEVLFRSEIFRNHITLHPKMNWLMTVPWLCAMSDLEMNYQFKSWRLSHIALEHGCTVCLKDLHRAINDVDLMWDMLKRSGTTPQELLTYKNEPWIYVSAKIEKPWLDGGRSSEIAKANGFSWERPRGDNSGRTFAKTWVTRIKAKDYDKLLTLPIQVERIQL